MTKLNHNRPSLRLLDNYRRELRNQALRVNAGLPMAQKLSNNPMPSVSAPARKLIFLMFDAANSYFDLFSEWLEAMSPAASKTLQRKQQARKRKLETAKEALIDACVALVLEAVQEAYREENGLTCWFEWLQEEAKRTDSSGLYDIIEIGMKPAFEKIEGTVGKL